MLVEVARRMERKPPAPLSVPDRSTNRDQANKFCSPEKSLADFSGRARAGAEALWAREILWGEFVLSEPARAKTDRI
jgi:hypothetical protein